MYVIRKVVWPKYLDLKRKLLNISFFLSNLLRKLTNMWINIDFIFLRYIYVRYEVKKTGKLTNLRTVLKCSRMVSYDCLYTLTILKVTVSCLVSVYGYKTFTECVGPLEPRQNGCLITCIIILIMMICGGDDDDADEDPSSNLTITIVNDNISWKHTPNHDMILREFIILVISYLIWCMQKLY